MRKLLLAVSAFFLYAATNAQTTQVNTKQLIAKDSFNLDGLWRKTFPNSNTVTGGVVTWLSGLTFAVTSAEYQIKNKVYKSQTGTITLNAAHVSLPRIDVIALDTARHIVKITGTAATTPAIPQINPATQVYLTAVFVGAGATTPGGVTILQVYDEDTEFSHSADFATINFSSTTSPQAGSKSILITGTNNTNDVSASGAIKFYNGATQYNYSDYIVLRFYIRLTQPWPATASLQVGAGSGGEPLTTVTEANGFNPSLVGAYQNISVPMWQIPKFANTFGGIYIVVTGNGKTFNVDNISLQGGIGGTGCQYVTNVFKKPGNDSVFIDKCGVVSFAYLDTGTGGGGGSVNSVNGTTNRITSTGGANPTIDISSTFENLFLKKNLAAATTIVTNGFNLNMSGGGFLGIGTGTPQAPLHIDGQPGLNAFIRLNSPSTINTFLQFADGGTSRTKLEYKPATQVTGIFSYGRSKYDFVVNDNTGSVGINTETPGGFNLDVNGTGKFTGSLTIITEASSDSSTKAASTAFVKKQLSDSAFKVTAPVASGVKLFNAVSSTNLQLKKLRAGTNVTLTDGSDSVIVIDATGGGASLAIGSTVTGATNTRLALFGTNGTLQQNSKLLFDSALAYLLAEGFKGSATNGDIILYDGFGNQTLRGTRANAWSDNVSTQHFQMGTAFGNIVMASQNSLQANRLMLSATTTHVTNSLYNAALVPTGILQVDDGTNVAFNINSTGVTQVKRSVEMAYSAKTANYTITNADYAINCTANSFTVTLPTAAGIAGRVYVIKNTGTATTITVSTTGGQTIDGSATQSLTTPLALTVMSNGTNWIVL
jgi:hypothetical protein